jgi:hypothetical protein
VSVQILEPADLSTRGKNNMHPSKKKIIIKKVEWAAEPVWRLWKRKHLLPHAGY